MRTWRQWAGALRAIGITAALACVVPVTSAVAQEIPIPNLEQYAKGAKEVTNVVLDKNTMALASGFMKGKGNGNNTAKDIVSKLNGIYIHTFEYDRDGAYNRKSVEQIRNQFKGPEWSNIVSSHESGKGDDKAKGEDTDIWMHIVNGTIRGMVIITAEPRELTFVQIDGPLRPEDLQSLQGNFGVPMGSPPGVPTGSPLPIPPKTKHGRDGHRDGHSETEIPAIPAMPAIPVIAAMPAIPAVPDPRPAMSYSGHPDPSK